MPKGELPDPPKGTVETTRFEVWWTRADGRGWVRAAGGRTAKEALRKADELRGKCVDPDALRWAILRVHRKTNREVVTFDTEPRKGEPA